MCLFSDGIGYDAVEAAGPHPCPFHPTFNQGRRRFNGRFQFRCEHCVMDTIKDIPAMYAAHYSGSLPIDAHTIQVVLDVLYEKLDFPLTDLV